MSWEVVRVASTRRGGYYKVPFLLASLSVYGSNTLYYTCRFRFSTSSICTILNDDGDPYAVDGVAHATDCSRHYTLPHCMCYVSAAQVLVSALKITSPEYFNVRPEATASIHGVSKTLVHGWLRKGTTPLLLKRIYANTTLVQGHCVPNWNQRWSVCSPVV